MNILESAILGGVQGLTEFVPVSSSAHLELIGRLVGGREANFHLFVELINIGTLLALVWFLKDDILRILKQVFVEKNLKTAINILLTSIPAGILGFLLSDLIRNNAFFSLIGVMAVAMGTVGILLIMAEKLPSLSKLKAIDNLTKTRALGIGLAQTLALIPGTSRSGITILAGRVMGFDAKSAARYSFLASIPIMTGVFLKSLVKDREYIANNLFTLGLSNLVAFIVGMMALKLVFKFLEKPGGLKYFGYYRVVLATILLTVVLVK